MRTVPSERRENSASNITAQRALTDDVEVFPLRNFAQAVAQRVDGNINASFDASGGVFSRSAHIQEKSVFVFLQTGNIVPMKLTDSTV